MTAPTFQTGYRSVLGSSLAAWLARAILVALVLCVYLRTARFPLLEFADDYEHIVRNPMLQPLSWAGIGQFWTTPYFGEYVPVTYMAFAVETWFAEWLRADEPGSALSGAPYHLGCVLLHAINTLLVFELLKRLVAWVWAAWAGAALFACHPLTVQAVAWVSETRNLLATGLSLAAMLLYFSTSWERDAGHDVQAAPTERGKVGAASGIVAYGAATTLFALALLSKPSAVTAPLVAGVIALAWLRRPAGRTVLELTPWLALALATAIVNKTQQPDDVIGWIAPLQWRPLIAIDATGHYLVKLAMPWDLSPDYGRTPRSVLEGPVRETWAWVLPVVIGAGVVLGRNRKLLPCLAVFVAGLLPTLGLASFFFQNVSTVSDRYAYFALCGASLALAEGLNHSQGPTRAAAILLSVVGFACCSYVSVDLCRHWRSPAALYHWMAACNPDSFTAHNNLCVLALRAGNAAEALDHAQRAAQLTQRNDHPTAHWNLGVSLMNVGRNDEAVTALKRAVQCSERPAATRADLALALVAAGQLAEAREQCRISLTASPDNVWAYVALARAARVEGNLAAAEPQYQLALDADPRCLLALLELAELRLATGSTALALEGFEQALALAPNHARAQQGLDECRRRLLSAPK